MHQRGTTFSNRLCGSLTRAQFARWIMLGLLVALPILHQQLHETPATSSGSQHLQAENPGGALGQAADACAICCLMPGGAVPLESAIVITPRIESKTRQTCPDFLLPAKTSLDSSSTRGPPA